MIKITKTETGYDIDFKSEKEFCVVSLSQEEFEELKEKIKDEKN